MADTCDAKLAGQFTQECGYKSKQGLRKKWYFNWSDVDRVATQITNKGTKITVLVLKLGAVLYPAQGNSKTLKAKHALSVLDFGNGYVHTDTLTIQYHGENERMRIQELVDGGRIGSIVEKVDGGVNGELTYEIFGYESGMTIIEDNYDSAGNSGTVTISVATEKGEEESTGKKLFLMKAGSTATGEWIEGNSFVPIVNPTVLKAMTISASGVEPCSATPATPSVNAWFAGAGSVPVYGDRIYTNALGTTLLNGSGDRYEYLTVGTLLTGTIAVTTNGTVYNPVGIVC
jgi:hypothetical protein